jgi:Ca-activated chloride channel family protein
MKDHADASFALTAGHGGDPPALTAVELEGTLDGVLLALTLRQTWRHAGPGLLEAVYTFPLPAGAALLGLVAEIDGQRLVGRVQRTQEAGAAYEQALADGHAPVLLERAGQCLYTANLGNVQPGETVTLELRFAQLLAFEYGRLRVAIPATIAPRHGSAVQAGLQPQQVPLASLAAEYPLALALTVGGSLARGRIDCPTHPHHVQRTPASARLQLAPGAVLDRDVVIVVTPAEPVPDTLFLGDDAASAAAPQVALAALTVPPGPVREAIALRLLVDCSGSMTGDSIASARQALHAVLAGLTPSDEASLTRFGSDVQHVAGAAACGPGHMARLRRAVDGSDAAMGGTDVAAALQAVFAAWPVPECGADLLLITDGGVWQADALAAAARYSGHRVFAIGVGTAPAEDVLRQLAEASGGAVAFATPGESLPEAARRMLARIRQRPLRAPRVDWGAAPVWELPPPPGLCGGGTALALAGFARGKAPQGPVRLLAAGSDGADAVVAATTDSVRVQGQDLARMAAARRLAGADDDEATRIALDHQLVARQAQALLVHERAPADRPARPARVQKVPGMLAAGWGGTGSVAMRAPDAPAAYSPRGHPSVWRHARAADPARTGALVGGLDDIEIPGCHMPGQSPLWPPMRELMRRVDAYLERGGSLPDLASEAQDRDIAPPLRQALQEIDALHIGRSRAWVLFALWVATRSDEVDPGPARRLAVHVGPIQLQVRRAVWEVLEQHLGRASGDGSGLAQKGCCEAGLGDLPRQHPKEGPPLGEHGLEGD